MPNLTEQMFQQLQERLRDYPEAVMPPPCFLEMQGEVIENMEGVRLSIRFPVQARYRNPWNFMQGGFLAAALDNTIGPFSFLLAPPNVTTQLQINYLRPVTAEFEHIVCIATVLESSGRTWLYQGRVLAPSDKVLAVAQASVQLV